MQVARRLTLIDMGMLRRHSVSYLVRLEAAVTIPPKAWLWIWATTLLILVLGIVFDPTGCVKHIPVVGAYMELIASRRMNCQAFSEQVKAPRGCVWLWESLILEEEKEPAEDLVTDLPRQSVSRVASRTCTDSL